MGLLRRRIVVLLLLVAVWGGLQPTFAAQFGDLYTVTVMVDPEAEDPRQDGFQRAMGALLVRLTGRRDAADDPDLLDVIEAAARFVQRWGFVEEERLAVTFDGRALEGELVRRDQPVWGGDRPLTLVWMALDTGGGDRRMLNGLETPLEEDLDAQLVTSVLTELADTARRRGLPLVYPLLDTEDLALVTAADIWGGFTSRVVEASRRYQPDGILIGRVRAVGDVRTARWQYLGADEQRERRGGISEGLEWLADIYASQYAVSGGNSIARLVVTDVRNFDDYARVITHLERLPMIDAVSVEELREDQLLVALETRGTADVLNRALSLGGVITPVTAPLAEPRAVGLDRTTARYFRIMR